MIARFNCHHELERRQLASKETTATGEQLTSIIQRPCQDGLSESRSASASSSETSDHLVVEEELKVACFKESRQKISRTTTNSSNQTNYQTDHKTNWNQKSNSCNSKKEDHKELSGILAIEPDCHQEREYFSDPDFHDERPVRRGTCKSRLRATSKSLDAARESESESEYESDSNEEQVMQECVPSGENLAQVEQASSVHESISDTDRETILSVRSVYDERCASSSAEIHEISLEINQPTKGDNQDSRSTDIELEHEQVSCQWTASEACAEFFEDDPEMTLADDEEDKDDLESDENEDTLHNDNDDDCNRGHTDNSDAGERPDIEETRPETITCSSEASQSGEIELDQESENSEAKTEISRVKSKISEPVNQSRAYEDEKLAVRQVNDEDLNDSRSPNSNSDVKIEKIMIAMREYCAELVELVKTEAIEQFGRILSSTDPIRDILLSSSDYDQERASRTRQTFDIDEIERPALISPAKVQKLCEQSDRSQDDIHQEQSVKTKQIYTSSLFYDDAEGSFPTIEKQIDRCQMIARQLESSFESRSLDKTAKQNLDSRGNETSPQQATIASNELTLYDDLSSQVANEGEKASLMFKSRRERMRHYTICSPYCIRDKDEKSGSTCHLRSHLKRCNSEPLDVSWCRKEQVPDTDIHMGDSIDIIARASNLSSGSSITDTEYEAPLVKRRRRSRLATDAKFQSCADIGSQQQQDGTSLVFARAACKYKPFLDSTTLKDIERLREWCPRATFNEHQSVSPELCKRLVEDLTQSEQLSSSESQSSRRIKSRGAILFERRQLQSSDWIVGGPQVKQKIPTTLNDCPDQRDGIAQQIAQVQVVVEASATNERIERMAVTENQREHLSSMASSTPTSRLSRPSIGEETVMVAEQGCLAEETSELIELTPLIMSHQQPRLELATITRTPSFSASSRHIIDERDNLPSLSSSLDTTDYDDDDDDNNGNDSSFAYLPCEQQQRADELTMGPKATETMDNHHAYLHGTAIEHRALVSWSQPKDLRPTSRLFECQKLIMPRTQYASLRYFSLDDHDDEDDDRAMAIGAAECRPPRPPSESQPRTRLPTLQGNGSPSDGRARLSTRPPGDFLSIGDAAACTLRTAGCKQQRPEQKHHSGIHMNEREGERQGGAAFENSSGRGAIDAHDDDERARRRSHPLMASSNKLPQSGNVGENMVQAAQSLQVCRCECTCKLAREAQQAHDNDNHAAWKWSPQQEQQQCAVATNALLFHSRPPQATRVPSNNRANLLQQTDYESGAIARTTAARELLVLTQAAQERASGPTEPTRRPIDYTGQYARVHHGSPAQLASVSVDRRPLSVASPRRPPEMGCDRGVPSMAPPRTATLARRGPPAVGVDGHLGVPVSAARSSSLSTAALTVAHQADGNPTRAIRDPNKKYYSRPGGTSRLLTLIGNHSSHAGDSNRVPCYWPSINEIRTGGTTTQTTTTGRGIEVADSEIRSPRVCVKTPMEAHRIVIERRPTVLRHVERH